MKRAKPRKAVVIGFDGAIPGFVLRFGDELPNIRALMERGVFSAAIPSWPTDTPTNWTTIATGAMTGTHGISGFFVQKPHEPFSESHATFDCKTDICEAEYIWEALGRGGMRSILVNYPTAFPVRSKADLIVGGSGVFEPEWVLANSTIYSTQGADGTRRFAAHNAEVSSLKVEFKKASGWKNMVSSNAPPLEAPIPMLTGLQLDWDDKGPIVRGQRSEKGQAYYHALVYADDGEKYSTVLVCKEKDAKEAVAVLREGQWSDWIYDEFTIHGKDAKGFFQFVLVGLSPDGEQVQLVRSPVGNAEGWSYPASLATELIKNVGPYLEGYECSAGLITGWFPLAMAFEQVRQHANYLADTCRYLTAKSDWNLLMVQLHLQDVFNHMYLGYLYPDTPYYSAADESQCREIFREVYKITDEMVGRVVNECVDDDTVVIVVSDHGAVPLKKQVRFVPELIKAGLIAYKEPSDDGLCEIDWSKTKVFPKDYIWVNVKGRNPDGIVSQGREYEEVRDKTIATLYSIIDPETGMTPFECVLKKERAALLGIWGDRIGDLVPIVSPEYAMVGNCPIRIKESMLKALLEMEPFQPLPRLAGERLLVGGHSGCWPDASVGDSSCSAMFIMAGPGVRKNYLNAKPTMSLADVAPTICHLIGAPRPKDADGKILSGFLEY